MIFSGDDSNNTVLGKPKSPFFRGGKYYVLHDVVLDPYVPSIPEDNYSRILRQPQLKKLNPYGLCLFSETGGADLPRSNTVSFSVTTGTAGSTVVVPHGCAFAPQIMFVTLSGNTNTTDSTGVTNYNKGFGVAIAPI